MDNLFDPFATQAPSSTANAANKPGLFNPFGTTDTTLVSVDSPSLSRRLLKKAGHTTQRSQRSLRGDSDSDGDDDSDDDDDESSSGSDSDEEPGDKAPGAGAARPGGFDSLIQQQADTPRDHIMRDWRNAQVKFVYRCAAHPDIALFEFQREVLRAGAFGACARLINDPRGDNECLLHALGLLTRITAKDSPKEVGVSLEYGQETLERLVEESSRSTGDFRIRALAIKLLAGVPDKTVLDRLGFFELAVGFLKETGIPQVVENAMSICVTNFSLEIGKQKRILDALGFERLTKWAKSEEADLKSCSAAFVSNLVANEECKLPIIHDGGLTILLRLMNAPGSPLFKVHACRGLANLALHGESHIPMLERGVLVILNAVIEQSGSIKDEIVRNACRCLAYLTKPDQPGGPEAVAFLQAEGLTKLTELSRYAPNDQIQRWARAVLDNVAQVAKKSSKGKFSAGSAFRSSNKKKQHSDRVHDLLERRPSVDDLGAWKLLNQQDATDAQAASPSTKLTSSKDPEDASIEAAFSNLAQQRDSPPQEVGRKRSKSKSKSKNVTRHQLLD